MGSYYTDDELEKIGIKNFGQNVLISKKASLYLPEKMCFGNNVRIDDFCILSGKIKIGNNVHISAYTSLYGTYGITIGDYCGCSPRCTIFSGSDDFSGDYMISPMVPEKYTNVDGREVIINNYSQIGANSILMPGVIVGEGAVCGAFSFVKNNMEEWAVYCGIPAKKVKTRHKNVKVLAKRYEDEI